MKLAKLEQKVKEKLKKRGEKLYQASEAIGYSKNFLGQLLKGRSPLSARNFIKICKYFNLKPNHYTSDGHWESEIFMPRKGFISDAENDAEVWEYHNVGTNVCEIVVDERFEADLFGKGNVFEVGSAFRVQKALSVTDRKFYLVSNGGRYKVVRGERIKPKQYSYVYEILSVRGVK